mmetsp:Transcript_71652/g.232987  ORF Transcript_71652/g.232987 Transcript_71652/m.232987 type:complete len:155 (-) Transcript_71652:1230-1694(-)
MMSSLSTKCLCRLLFLIGVQGFVHGAPRSQENARSNVSFETEHIPYVDLSWCAVERHSFPQLWGYREDVPRLKVRVLTYNLNWWDLFGMQGGNNGSAGKLIGWHARRGVPFDFMGFRSARIPSACSVMPGFWMTTTSSKLGTASAWATRSLHGC